MSGRCVPADGAAVAHAEPVVPGQHVAWTGPGDPRVWCRTDELAPGHRLATSPCVSVVNGPWTVLEVGPPERAKRGSGYVRRVVVLDADSGRRFFFANLVHSHVLAVTPTT